MVDQGVAEPRVQRALGNRHADGVGEPLAKRAGGGLDSGGVAVLGVARRLRAELAEALDLGQAHVLVAGQIEERVEQHRAVPGREHEAVAVGPVGRARVELQEPRKQDGGHVRHAHGHSRMARLRLLDRVGREKADGVGHERVAGAGGRMGSGRGRIRRGGSHLGGLLA